MSVVGRVATRLRRVLRPYSDLDRVIPPEVNNDDLYAMIRTLAAEAPVTTMLEIGSSSGTGSTRAFVEGMLQNPHSPSLFCLEVSSRRHAELARRYAHLPSVHTYNLPSVLADDFPSEEVVTEYFQLHGQVYGVRLPELIRWLRQDIAYTKRLRVEQGGIQVIKDQNRIDTFGIVLIDGSEFTGNAELQQVIGADYLILDDTRTFKNAANRRLLADSPEYELIAESGTTRNGFAAFRRRP
jgi:hypothetical protein